VTAFDGDETHELAEATAASLIGLPEDEAKRRVVEAGLSMRISHGEPFRSSYQRGRISAFAEDGVIVRAQPG
jgi:hypothetical protein